MAYGSVGTDKVALNSVVVTTRKDLALARVADVSVESGLSLRLAVNA